MGSGNSSTVRRIARFGVFEFDLAGELLCRSGMRVKLPPQPASLLGLLLAEPGTLVTREAIRARLWPDGTWVEYEQSINQCIRAVRRALRDDAVAARFIETVPRLGYRFVGEVEIVEASSAAAPPVVHQRGPAIGVRVAIAGGMVLLFALGLGVARLTRDTEDPLPAAGPFARVRVDKLTNHGAVWTAAISPAGDRIAYAVQEDGGFAVRTKSIGDARDTKIVEPQATPIRALAFGQSGSDLYFVRQETAGPGYSALFHVSSLGENPRRLVFDVDSGIALSPDGARFAFVRGLPLRESSALVTVGRDGSDERVVAEWSGAERLVHVPPAWSPDGSRIAVAATRARQALHVVISTIEVAGGPALAIGAYPWQEVTGLAWLPDGSGLVIAARGSDAESRSQLWRLDYPAGAVHRISNDLSGYACISLASGGHRFVTLRQERLDPVLAFEPLYGEVRRRALDFVPANAALVVRRGPDGSAIVAARDTQRTLLWRVAGPDATPEPLLDEDGSDVRGVSVSPDGATIVYAVWGSDGTPHLWSLPARGGTARQWTSGGGEYAPAPCSTGMIVFRRQDASGLWSVTGPDQAPRQLTDLEPSGAALCSPDGTAVAFVTDVERDDRHERTLVVWPVEGARATHFMPWPDGQHLSWSPAGDALTYAGRPEAPHTVWRIALGAAEATPIHSSQAGGIASFDWSADGRAVLAIHSSMQSDVVLVEDAP